MRVAELELTLTLNVKENVTMSSGQSRTPLQQRR